MQISEHFTTDDFKCKCGKDHANWHMYDGLVFIVEKMQYHFDKRVQVEAGYRCPEYSLSLGARSDSYHTMGQAINVMVKDTTPAEVYAYLCNTYGVEYGMGIIQYKTYVHIDVRNKAFRKGGDVCHAAE